MKDLIKTNCSY